MEAKDFEQQFDEDVELTTSLDLSKARRVLQEQRRVNADFPTWMMQKFKTPFRCLLALFFIAAGINHFWHTPFYVAMMPPYLPAPLALVYLSGVAEIGLGALLLFSRWQVIAGWGLIALSVAVFPANVHMALNPELFTQFSPTGLWLRLPLQAVVIAWAYWTTRPAARIFAR